MHWKICKEFGIEAKEQWYEHEPKAITEKDSVMILWDMPIHTDRTIAANRPDITLKSKKDKTCLLIDMTIPLDTPGGGGTLGISGWGCAAGTLEPLTYTRASSAEFCYPILE